MGRGWDGSRTLLVPFCVPQNATDVGCEIEIWSVVGCIKLLLTKSGSRCLHVSQCCLQPEKSRAYQPWCLVICESMWSCIAAKHRWGQSLALHHLWQWEGYFTSGCRCGMSLFDFANMNEERPCFCLEPEKKAGIGWCPSTFFLLFRCFFTFVL